MVKNSFVLFFCIVLSASLIAETRVENNQTQVLIPSLEQFKFKQKILNSTRFENTHELQQQFSGSLVFTENQQGAPKKKGRAFLQSLLLPGWGQHYAESKAMMKVFIASEVLLWGSFVGLTTWGNWLEDDYRTFSVEHAGVNLAGKSDVDFVNISIYADIFAYNQDQLRNRDVNAVYTDTESFFWKWDSEHNRRQFDDMRIRSDRARNRADLTLAFIFTNHVISAIQSTLAVFKFNKGLQKHDLGLKLDYNSYSANRYFRVGLVKQF
ncbi:MAG: hypothetical protein E2O79_04155 [Caldithrix sp.]|nr:MAG: hypothetical protein E2O79_04155 [Caldithrix sp.]